MEPRNFLSREGLFSLRNNRVSTQPLSLTAKFQTVLKNTCFCFSYAREFNLETIPMASFSRFFIEQFGSEIGKPQKIISCFQTLQVKQVKFLALLSHGRCFGIEGLVETFEKYS